MNRKRKPVQRRASQNASAKLSSFSKKSSKSSVRLDLSPEHLYELGRIEEAITALRSLLSTQGEDDERRRLLGHWLFEQEHYTEAAQTWQSLDNQTAQDWYNCGAAWSNAKQWDQAQATLKQALEQEADAATYFLLAQVLLRETQWYSDHDPETEQQIYDLLQQARTCSDCFAQVYTRLADLQWTIALRAYRKRPRLQDKEQEEQARQEERMAYRQAREQKAQLLAEAFELFSDDMQVRLEYAEVIAALERYETVLLIVAPLLPQSLSDDYWQARAFGLSIEASLGLHLYKKALDFLHQYTLSPTHLKYDRYNCWGKLLGDIALLAEDYTAARTYYQQECTSPSFVNRCLGQFSLACLDFREGKEEQARASARDAILYWFEEGTSENRYRVLDSVPPSICMSYLEPLSSDDCIQQSCNLLLQKREILGPSLEAKASFLLYAYHDNRHSSPLDTCEQRAEFEKLLLRAEQFDLHPAMYDHLAAYYKEHHLFPQAIKYHLLTCLELYADEEDPEEWDEDIVAFSFDDDVQLTREERLAIHREAWLICKSHLSDDAGPWIFKVFYRSFWRALLRDGGLHEALVAVAGQLEDKEDENDSDILWDYACSSCELRDWQGAERAFRRYLAGHPNNMSALYNIAFVLLQQNRLQEALVFGQQASTFEAKDANGQRLLQSIQRAIEARRPQWNALKMPQKVLLYVIDERRPGQCADLDPYISMGQPESLQQAWEHFVQQHYIIPSQQHEAQICEDLLPNVRTEGLLLWLIATIINAQPRKKQPWIPTLDEFAPDALSEWNMAQRRLFHKIAFRCLQACSREELLAEAFLPLYRTKWRQILTEGYLYAEACEVLRHFTTNLPLDTVHSEWWDLASYCESHLHQRKEAEDAYKRLLEGGTNAKVYHRLAIIVGQDGRLEEALAYVDQALALQPEQSDFCQYKAQLSEKIEQQKQELIQKQQQDEQERRKQENFLRTARARWSQVDYFKRQLLATLTVISGFEGWADLARLSGIEERSLKTHWNKLVQLGMIIEAEQGYSINPEIIDLAKQERSHSVVTRIIHASGALNTKPIFDSQNEYKIYQVLLELFPHHLVFPNMACSAVFGFDQMQAILEPKTFDYFLRARVDFCITSTSNYLPLVAFEVDSRFHDTEKQMVRDERKDTIFALGGLELIRLRFQGNPTPGTIRQKISEEISAWGRRYRVTPHEGLALNIEQEIDFHSFESPAPEQ